MKPILAVNCGSSSLKRAVIDVDAQARLLDVRILELGSPECRIFVNEADGRACRCDDVAAAMGLAIDEIDRSPWGASLAAVGHRIVHGGAEFSGPLLLDEASIAAITKVSGLAPLHNTPALAAVKAARQRLGSIPHVGVFDTAFHATLPRRAREYAIAPAQILALAASCIQLAEAAALPVVGLTAFHALFDIAQLLGWQGILIRGAC